MAAGSTVKSKFTDKEEPLRKVEEEKKEEAKEEKKEEVKVEEKKEEEKKEEVLARKPTE